MARLLVRWAVPALVGLACVGLVGLPAIAQSGDKPTTPDVSRAKEMAALIEQGQLNLRDATALAEKHAKGTALDVSCTLEPAGPQPLPGAPIMPPGEQSGPDRPKGGPSVQIERSGANRLIYTVSCFAKDQVTTIRVDGLAKKVVESPAHK
jgi:hypothetical protein